MLMFLDKITLIILMYSFTKLEAHQPRKESLLGRNKVQWLCDLTAGGKNCFVSWKKSV